MIEILKACLIITCIHGLFKEGNLLFPIAQFLNRFLDNRYGKYLAKPLYQCLFCMSSVHGTWIYFVNYKFISLTESLDINYLMFIFAIGGLNYLTSNYLDKAGAATKDLCPPYSERL